jgi:type I restriction-modification system DNA methylase subunit
MLRHAASLVGGQRAKDYGDKTENHQRIADLWNYWMEASRDCRMVDTNSITAYDVSIMMLLLKVARLMHTPGHSDSHVDIAGYASIAEEISRTQEKKNENT